jgi:hypothetical protein
MRIGECRKEDGAHGATVFEVRLNQEGRQVERERPVSSQDVLVAIAAHESRPFDFRQMAVLYLLMMVGNGMAIHTVHNSAAW